MAVRRVLQLGDPALHEVSRRVSEAGIREFHGLLEDLRDTLLAFQRRWGTGSAIAAPQIGVLLRVVRFQVAGLPEIALNPEVVRRSPETVESWESCMSFPELLVRTARSKTCVLEYAAEGGQRRSVTLSGEAAITAQHECDHLDGILAVFRAAGEQAFCLRSQWSRRAVERPHDRNS